MKTPARCIFCTRTNRLIDFVPDGHDGARLIATYVTDYGTDLVMMPTDTAWQRYENAFKSSPVEISEDRWNEMLGVLPPVAWTTDQTGESFKLSERTAGSITAIFVRIGERNFELSDSITLPHRACTARVRATFFPAE